MIYRPEVDGMRAFAVLSVILFHAGLNIVGGGFLGVDVFFVISGYLITGIIEKELGNESFSIVGFYKRRIRRIVPALNVMMLLCVPVAYILLIPDDLENFGQSLVSTSLFSNNILLLVTTGYFALETEFKPLMHTWSLGVEEHYYIGIPLILSLVYRIRGQSGVLFATAAISLASFAFCIWASAAAPSANFYLVFSRAWELGAGGLVALLEPASRLRMQVRPRLGSVLSFAGLFLAAIPMFTFSASMALPGWLTALPIVGVSLLLMFADKARAPGSWLAAKPVVFIGLLSYSAYLFHQPVFVFARVSSLAEPSLYLMLALIPPIFLLAYLSWRFVEKPFRNKDLMSFRRVAMFSIVTTGLVVGAGLTFYFTSGFYRNWPELASGDPGFGAKQNAAFNQGPMKYLNTSLPQATSKTNVLVVGNSFARDFINMGLVTHNLDHHNISYAHVDECRPLPLEAIENARRAEFIVIATNFTVERVACISDRVAELERVGRARVYVLGTKGFGWNNNAVMLLPRDRRYKYRALPLREIIAANELARARFPGMYIDLLGMLGDREGRVPVFTPQGMFISQDRAHLTQAGASYVGNILFEHPAMRELARGRKMEPGGSSDAP